MKTFYFHFFVSHFILQYHGILDKLLIVNPRVDRRSRTKHVFYAEKCSNTHDSVNNVEWRSIKTDSLVENQIYPGDDKRTSHMYFDDSVEMANESYGCYEHFDGHSYLRTIDLNTSDIFLIPTERILRINVTAGKSFKFRVLQNEIEGSWLVGRIKEMEKFDVINEIVDIVTTNLQPEVKQINGTLIITEISKIYENQYTFILKDTRMILAHFEIDRVLDPVYIHDFGTKYRFYEKGSTMRLECVVSGTIHDAFWMYRQRRLPAQPISLPNSAHHLEMVIHNLRNDMAGVYYCVVLYYQNRYNIMRSEKGIYIDVAQ